MSQRGTSGERLVPDGPSSSVLYVGLIDLLIGVTPPESPPILIVPPPWAIFLCFFLVFRAELTLS